MTRMNRWLSVVAVSMLWGYWRRRALVALRLRRKIGRCGGG